jgi:hypothetical protein
VDDVEGRAIHRGQSLGIANGLERGLAKVNAGDDRAEGVALAAADQQDIARRMTHDLGREWSGSDARLLCGRRGVHAEHGKVGVGAPERFIEATPRRRDRDVERTLVRDLGREGRPGGVRILDQALLQAHDHRAKPHFKLDERHGVEHVNGLHLRPALGRAGRGETVGLGQRVG